MTPRLTRRTALLALAATPALAAAFPAFAQVPGASPAAGLRIRSVVVDATRVAALGNPDGADRLAVVLARQMRKVFADLIVPNATDATLVARISSLYLVSYAGSGTFGRRGSGGGDDSLEGVGIVTAGGRAVSQTSVLAVLDPGYSGPWYLPDIDERRLESIAYQFAWWLRREMGV